MWIRLHTPPKVEGLRSRMWTTSDLTPKERYYYERSLSRYNLTEDGRYLSELAPRFVSGEIGRIEGFTVINSEENHP